MVEARRWHSICLDVSEHYLSQQRGLEETLLGLSIQEGRTDVLHSLHQFIEQILVGFLPLPLLRPFPTLWLEGRVLHQAFCRGQEKRLVVQLTNVVSESPFDQGFYLLGGETSGRVHHVERNRVLQSRQFGSTFWFAGCQNEITLFIPLLDQVILALLLLLDHFFQVFLFFSVLSEKRLSVSARNISTRVEMHKLKLRQGSWDDRQDCDQKVREILRGEENIGLLQPQE